MTAPASRFLLAWGVSHPALLATGAALIIVPLVIHWFSRRRVRTVDWAAFEFLLGAHRRDRRRVRIENWLLLALRCLLVLLVGMLVARPWAGRRSAALVSRREPIEHLFVLDDTQSMRALADNESAFEAAVRFLIAMCGEKARDSAGDTVTVWITSRPDQPILLDVPLAIPRLAELSSRLEALVPTDAATPLGVALGRIREQLQSRPAHGTRALTVWTDLRACDWPTEVGDEHPERVLALLARDGVVCALGDVGGSETGNLQVVRIEGEAAPADNVPVRFFVTLRNTGPSTSRDLQVEFVAGDAQPETVEIAELPAGESTTFEFPFTFLATPEVDTVPAASNSARPSPSWRDVPIEARVISGHPEHDNRLAADDVSHHTARIWPSLPVVIVDRVTQAGDQPNDAFFLSRALAPEGAPSGFHTQIVPETDLESVALESIHVVFLCNVFRLTEPAVAQLEAWVREGGGLVIMPGEQVDVEWHNQRLVRGGRGLAPLELRRPHGGDQRQQWAKLEVSTTDPSPMNGFTGTENPLLHRMKVYRWWDATLAPPGPDGSVVEWARLAEGVATPAVAARRWGRGQVVEVAFPAGNSWTNWPTEPGYVVFVQEVATQLVANRLRRSEIRVGQPIRQPVDLAHYEPSAILRTPDQRSLPVEAVPARDSRKERSDAEPTGQPPSTEWWLTSNDTTFTGIYHWELVGTDSQPTTIATAVVSDPREGELARANVAALRRRLATDSVTVAPGAELLASVGGVGQVEIAWSIGWCVLGLLLVEPWFAWRVGRQR